MSPSGQEPARSAAMDFLGTDPRPRRGGRITIGLLAVVVLVSGCDRGRGGQDETGLTAGKFVEVVTALREAERSVAWEDSAAVLFTERKAEILEREGVTAEELRAFVASRDASELEQIWDVIAERLRYVPEAGDPLRSELDGAPEPDPARDTARDRQGDPAREPPPLQGRSLRRGPPSFPAPPVPVDTGERRLH